MKTIRGAYGVADLTWFGDEQRAIELGRKLALLESSRWVRLGRRVGLGPDAGL